MVFSVGAFSELPFGALPEAASASISITPPSAGLVVTGYAPSVGQSYVITPAAGALVLTGTAPTVQELSWSVTDSWTQTHTSSGWNGYTHRLRVDASLFADRATTHVRLTYTAQSTGAASVASVYVGVAASSGDSWDYAATPVAVKFAGAAGFSIGIGESIVSDPIELALDGTQSLLISGYSSASCAFAGQATRTGWECWYKSGDDAATVDATGYTVNARAAVGVTKIELSPAASSAVITPAAGAIVLTGAAPSVGQSYVITPNAASVVLTGSAPDITVGNSFTITPAAGALVFTGAAPAVGQSYVVTPDAGALVLTGTAPDITVPGYIVPAAGEIVLTGAAPTLGYSYVITPGAAAIVLTGAAPDISMPGVIVPDAGAVVLTGAAPTLGYSYVIIPDAAALLFSGAVPEVTLYSADGWVAVSTAAAGTWTPITPSAPDTWTPVVTGL